MAKPIERHEEINNFLENTTGMNSAITNDTCWHCKQSATEFRDEVSRTEFSISGLCQGCQDIAFAEEEDDEW